VVGTGATLDRSISNDRILLVVSRMKDPLFDLRLKQNRMGTIVRGCYLSATQILRRRHILTDLTSRRAQVRKTVEKVVELNDRSRSSWDNSCTPV
jgi:hypothetical protein